MSFPSYEIEDSISRTGPWICSSADGRIVVSVWRESQIIGGVMQGMTRLTTGDGDTVGYNGKGRYILIPRRWEPGQFSDSELAGIPISCDDPTAP